MTTVATIRVTALAGDRPDKARLEAAATLLRSRGFDVRKLGRFGVSVAADEATFQRELGVKVARGQALSAAPRVHDTQLAKLIDLVEVTPAPTSFW